jgi:hypothetical protein
MRVVGGRCHLDIAHLRTKSGKIDVLCSVYAMDIKELVRKTKKGEEYAPSNV